MLSKSHFIFNMALVSQDFFDQITNNEIQQRLQQQQFFNEHKQHVFSMRLMYRDFCISEPSTVLKSDVIHLVCVFMLGLFGMLKSKNIYMFKITSVTTLCYLWYESFVVLPNPLKPIFARIITRSDQQAKLKRSDVQKRIDNFSNPLFYLQRWSPYLKYQCVICQYYFNFMHSIPINVINVENGRRIMLNNDVMKCKNIVSTIWISFCSKCVNHGCHNLFFETLQKRIREKAKKTQKLNLLRSLAVQSVLRKIFGRDIVWNIMKFVMFSPLLVSNFTIPVQWTKLNMDNVVIQL